MSTRIVAIIVALATALALAIAGTSYSYAEGEDSADATGSGVNMGNYITSVSFQKKNGVIWEESSEFTTADQVRATMNFEKMYTSTLKENGNTVYIDLPAYIDCSRFTGTYDTYDGGTHSGTYTYQQNADGTYRIVLKLDDDYVENAGDVIGGSLQFNFQWTKDAVTDEGSKKVEIGDWSGDIKVTEDDSGKEDTSSANYNIKKSAGSLYYSTDGKTAYIDYTVTLTVKNEMTAPITMQDVLTGDGFTYDSTINVSGGDVKVNFGSTEGQGTSTQIQLWPNSGDKVPAGTYTITYRVRSLNDVSDPGTTVPSAVSNKITGPKDGDDSGISSETHTSTTTGTINKQGQLVSGSDATYIDYTVYLNAGDIIKNLKTPANFTDTLPDTLELQGDVTVKQYDVTGKEVGTATATVNGQNISYTTPTGQYYYIITYRTKVKDSEIPIGGITVKNDGNSTGGIDGSSSSEITVPNHVLSKDLVNGSTGKDADGNWIRTSNWKSTVNVKGDLDGYSYEDWSSLIEDTSKQEFVAAMKLVSGSVVVKDADGNTVSSDLYTLEGSDHTTTKWSDSKGNVPVPDGLFKITFKGGVTGPVTIEYQTTADLSLHALNSYTGVTNYAELSKDGQTDTARGQDSFQFVTDNKGLIYKKKDNNEWDNTSGTTTLNPGETSIPWVILVNRSKTLTSDLTITDTIKDGLIFLEDTFDIQINGQSIKNADGVTWAYDKTTGKLTVNIKASAYQATNQSYPSNDITISFRTQLPDDVINSGKTEITYKNTASLETDGSTTDSTYDQTVIRQVVGKSGSYDKTTKILSYNVVVNPDASTLNGGKTLTVTDTLDAGQLKDYITLHSLEVFTALKTTDASGNVKVEPGKLVKELTPAESGSEEFTYTWDDANKSFTTYLPDGTAYVIVAKYYVGIDVTQAVNMKNTVKIEGNDNWKKEDSSTNVDQSTSGETHTEKDKITVTKHDAASYNTLLKGASFELDKYDASSKAWTKFGTLTTGSNGQGSIEDIEYNTLYKLGETQAPDGYVVDEGPVYFIVVRESGKADAKKNLPDSISGDKSYSKDAVKVYTVKDNPKNSDGTENKQYFANIEIDRYNSVDDSKVEPGQLRVTKKWVDSKGDAIADASSMPEITATLTKHVVNKGHTITLQAPNVNDQVFASGINDGAYVFISYQGAEKWSDAELPEGVTIVFDHQDQTNWANIYKLGPITSDITLNNQILYYNSGTFDHQEGGTPASGTTDTVIGTVTLNADNDWTYLWSDLDRGDGVTYTLTETTVDGYTATYQINGTDLEAGTAFTPSDEGDKVVITNTANRQYELPSTGGMGALVVVGGGLAMVLVAVAGLAESRRHRVLAADGRGL